MQKNESKHFQFRLINCNRAIIKHVDSYHVNTSEVIYMYVQDDNGDAKPKVGLTEAYH